MKTKRKIGERVSQRITNGINWYLGVYLRLHIRPSGIQYVHETKTHHTYDLRRRWVAFEYRNNKMRPLDIASAENERELCRIVKEKFIRDGTYEKRKLLYPEFKNLSERDFDRMIDLKSKYGRDDRYFQRLYKVIETKKKVLEV